MKRISMLMMGGLAVSVALCGCGKKEAEVVVPNDPASEIVLHIDNADFTRAQVMADLAKFERQLPAGLSEDDLNRRRNANLVRVLDSLITRQLVQAEMERQNATVSSDEIAAAKQQLFGHMQNEDAMAIMLAENNLTMEQLEANLKLDIFRNRLLHDEVAAAQAAITEETARKFYDENIQMFTQPAGRTAAHILVRVSSAATDEERAAARKKIEGVRDALLKGADFAQLARETSDCVSASRGGELGLIPKGREDPAFEEALYSQELGEIGEIVETGVGFHVIKAEEDLDEQVAPFDTVKDRLVARLRSDEQRRIGHEFIESLRAKANIRFDGSLAVLNPPEDGEAAPAAAPAGDVPEVDVSLAEESLAPAAEAPADSAAE